MSVDPSSAGGALDKAAHTRFLDRIHTPARHCCCCPLPATPTPALTPSTAASLVVFICGNCYPLHTSLPAPARLCLLFTLQALLLSRAASLFPLLPSCMSCSTTTDISHPRPPPPLPRLHPPVAFPFSSPLPTAVPISLSSSLSPHAR